ncbi:hypothetical protein BDI4_100009 [Burkholderia diffusa]|nr:hypothetical protein BDI4_100009 [Burkholderia diffusa]
MRPQQCGRGRRSAAGLAGLPTGNGCRRAKIAVPQPGGSTNGRRHSKTAPGTPRRAAPLPAEAGRMEKTWFLETRRTA